MQSRGSSSRLTGFVRRSRISSLMLSMLAMMSTIYVAGRLWQDAENRVYLIKEMDRRTGQGHPAISVDDTWKIIACKDQKKKLLALEAELATAREEGFVAKYTPNMNGTYHKRRVFLVVGIATEISHKKNRDAIRRSWMPTVGSVQMKIVMHYHYYMHNLFYKSTNGMYQLGINDLFRRWITFGAFRR